MKSVNLSDGTWKRAKHAAIEADVPLREYVEQAVIARLQARPLEINGQASAPGGAPREG